MSDVPPMPDDLLQIARAARGFMPDDEGMALYEGGYLARGLDLLVAFLRAAGFLALAFVLALVLAFAFACAIVLIPWVVI